jgi:hypothetical protein
MARKRVGDIGPGAGLTLLILGAGGIAVYFIGKDLNWWGSGSSTESTMSAATVQQDLTTAAATDPPNYTASQYSGWADSIYAAPSSISNSFSDSTTVNNIMDQIWNDADFLSLVQAFGTRKACPLWSGLTLNTIGCQQVDLFSFVTQGFTTSMIQQFNTTLGYNGVTYHF